MGRVDVERKRKTAWPWVVGLGMFILALWGVTSLLAEGGEAEPEVTVPTVEDTHPPAAVPAPPDAEPEANDVSATRGIGEIAPLGEEDVGQTIRLEGQVVATGNDAFWLLADGDVVRVDSPRRVRKGDTISIGGTLRPADPSTTDRIASAVLSRYPTSSDWNVVRVIKLVEEDGGAGAPRPEA